MGEPVTKIEYLFDFHTTVAIDSNMQPQATHSAILHASG